jgi:phosphonate transport system ATP-binding protein
LISSPRSNEGSPFRLSLADVTVRFGETLALEDVTLDVEPGERLAVIGASGAGKSTLFRALTRTVALTGGTVALGEHNLYTLSKKELKRVRSRVGTIFQAYNLVPQLPAGVNAALGEVGGMGNVKALRTFLRGPDRTVAGRVEAALERVGLAGLAHQRTADLSGGQQQRVAVARLLVQRPDLVLADEPFAAIDPVTTERVMEALLELNGEGATLVVNLHDVQIARRFPRIVALREGRLVFAGSPETLTDEILYRIYAGDPYGAGASPVEQPPEDALHCRQDPVRILEGQDGISAH